jgi:Tfp pilus assembly protein PilN
MKAVNLIPGDARRGGGPSLARVGTGHLLVGLLVIAFGFVTLAVLTNNTISSRKAQLADLQQQTTQLQAQAARLKTYQDFEKLAQARAATVRQIAATRFDWHAALEDLSRVVPSNTSLQSLTATVSPTDNVGGGSGGGSSVRGDIDAPAFALTGCTRNQDDVARLMSQLRLINGVTRVTLEDSAASASASGTSTTGCAVGGPTFDMVIFFQPMATTTTSTATGATG